MEKDDKITVKVIMVGDSGVGKTSLLRSINNENFENGCMPTISPSFQIYAYKNDNNKAVNLQIWDTAGQEKYHSVSQLFFRNADFAFVCYVAGNVESMKSCHKWIEMIKNQAPECNLIMVATKQDALLHDQMSDVISVAENEFNKYNICSVFMTSAKSSFGIGEMMTFTGNLAIENEKAQFMELIENTQSRSYCC